MAGTELQDRSGTRMDSGKIDEFAAALAGRLIRPADPDYDAARRIWNAAIDKHPGLIVRCLGVADVVQAVKFARANDLLVAVRGGGHNVAGRALCDNGLVIDLSAMRGVLVDPTRARCGCRAAQRSATSTERPICTDWRCLWASCRRPALPG